MKKIKNTDNDSCQIERIVSLPSQTKLIHFSEEAVELIYSVKEQKVNDKPNGFWVSVENNGDGWKNWCEGESFNTGRLVYENEIIISKLANILLITKNKELDDFHKKYQAALVGMERWGNQYIDWRSVAKDYQGIIITPYLYNRRFDKSARWYYGWDCASGCIWNKEAIKSIKARKAS